MIQKYVSLKYEPSSEPLHKPKPKPASRKKFDAKYSEIVPTAVAYEMNKTFAPGTNSLGLYGIAKRTSPGSFPLQIKVDQHVNLRIVGQPE